MAQYFFKMSQAEKNNILDQHKTIYDGYVTQFGQNSNQQPLYVQDFANDKGGIVVTNKGDVKPYTNVGINESFDRRDRIADGPTDLKNGTVDFDNMGEFDLEHTDFMHDIYPSPNEEEDEFVSLGTPCKTCDNDNLDIVIDFDPEEAPEVPEYDFYGNFADYSEDLPGSENIEVTGDSFADEVSDDELPDFMEKLNESLDMFKRFKKYN